MSAILLIARRELGAYARSPVGSIVIAAGLLVSGLWFYSNALAKKLLSAKVMEVFIETASGLTMILGVILAMRLFAEERQTKTDTLLSTAPVTEWQVVLGKYLSAMGMIAIWALLTIYMPLLVVVNGKVSLGHVLVGYSGVLLLGSATVAIVMFASSLARTQLLALILGAVFMAVLVVMWFGARAADPPLSDFMNALALHHQNFRPFMHGIVKLDGVVYYVVVTYFFLLASTKVLEARRWR